METPGTQRGKVLGFWLFGGLSVPAAIIVGGFVTLRRSVVVCLRFALYTLCFLDYYLNSLDHLNNERLYK